MSSNGSISVGRTLQGTLGSGLSAATAPASQSGLMRGRLFTVLGAVGLILLISYCAFRYFRQPAKLKNDAVGKPVGIDETYLIEKDNVYSRASKTRFTRSVSKEGKLTITHEVKFEEENALVLIFAGRNQSKDTVVIAGTKSIEVSHQLFLDSCDRKWGCLTIGDREWFDPDQSVLMDRKTPGVVLKPKLDLIASSIYTITNRDPDLTLILSKFITQIPLNVIENNVSSHLLEKNEMKLSIVQKKSVRYCVLTKNKKNELVLEMRYEAPTVAIDKEDKHKNGKYISTLTVNFSKENLGAVVNARLETET